jgi:hypothetical protein
MVFPLTHVFGIWFVTEARAFSTLKVHYRTKSPLLSIGDRAGRALKLQPQIEAHRLFRSVLRCATSVHGANEGEPVVMGGRVMTTIIAGWKSTGPSPKHPSFLPGRGEPAQLRGGRTRHVNDRV